jgi:copper(I)-binding protein
MTLRRSFNAARSFRRISVVACVAGTLTLAAGCGDDSKSSDTTSPTSLSAGSAPGGAVSLTGAWARTSPAMAMMGAAYVTMTSPADDKLTGAKVDAAVAASAEVHETVMTDGGSDATMATGSDTTMGTGGGEMTMRPVAFVDLPAGVAVEMKPGGYHIMLIDLVKPLEVGTSIKLTLLFEKAGEITIDLPVLDEAP